MYCIIQQDNYHAYIEFTLGSKFNSFFIVFFDVNNSFLHSMFLFVAIQKIM